MVRLAVGVEAHQTPGACGTSQIVVRKQRGAPSQAERSVPERDIHLWHCHPRRWLCTERHDCAAISCRLLFVGIPLRLALGPSPE